VIDLDHAVATAMDELSLKAVDRTNSDLSNQCEQFIKYYIYMLVNFAKDPLCKWIPKLFQ
jgi:adenylate cyclase